MNMMLQITICPTCGSDKVKKVRRNWSSEHQGRTYTVPLLEFYECPNCGEKIYDRQAMRKIETYSPAFTRTRGSKSQRSNQRLTSQREKRPRVRLERARA